MKTLQEAQEGVAQWLREPWFRRSPAARAAIILAQELANVTRERDSLLLICAKKDLRVEK